LVVAEKLPTLVEAGDLRYIFSDGVGYRRVVFRRVQLRWIWALLAMTFTTAREALRHEDHPDRR
jgi:hypothetical protein